MMCKGQGFLRASCLIAAAIGVVFAGSIGAMAAKPGGGGGGPPPVNVGYSIVFLGSLGSGWSRADDMNHHGDVVGQSRLSGGTSLAFVYPAGASAMQRLDSALDPQLLVRLNNAYGINDLGQVVGTGNHVDGNGSSLDAFNYRLTPDTNADGYAELEQIGAASPTFGPNPEFHAINNNGDLAGLINVGDETHAAVYSDDYGIVDLGIINGWYLHSFAINDRVNGILQITGQANTPTGPRGWRYTGDAAGNGTIQDLGSLWTSSRFSYGSVGSDINDAGVVAGWTSTGSKDNRAARYGANGWQVLGTLATTNDWNDSAATALNDAGHTVGTSMIGLTNQQRAFLFVDGFKMTDLDSLVVNLPAAQVGHITPVEVANPDSGLQFGVICGNTDDAQSFVLVPDR